MSVDPLAKEFPSWSTYSHTLNNPITFIDPDGRAPKKANDCCPPDYSLFYAHKYGGGESFNRQKTVNQMSGLGTIAGVAIALTASYSVANPATSLEIIRNVGMSVSEALTEQQMATWGKVVVVGSVPIKRIGKMTPDLVEINIDGLAFWHKVPRSNQKEPLKAIDKLAKSFQDEGFRLYEAPHVVKVNDQYIISDGMHRTAAMYRAGEKTIPARIFNWDDLPTDTQNDFLNTPGFGDAITKALDGK